MASTTGVWDGNRCSAVAARDVGQHLQQMRVKASELPDQSGVYIMHQGEEILYVGKAQNLRKRVSSYFSGKVSNERLTRLVHSLDHFRITVTNNEAEALLLEDILIKKHRPPYNILLRDDKSYPWIRITQHESPAVLYHRGARNKPGRYFGPFVSVPATRQTINELHRTFRLRNCTDSTFSNRSRPCLQHQIGRCSAPCVGLIGAEEYRADCEKAIRVLEGQSEAILDELQTDMAQASQKQEYEQAAKYRNRIVSLQKIRQNQAIYIGGSRDCDVIAAAEEAGAGCVSVVQVRGGEVSSTATHFPQLPKKSGEDVGEDEIVRAFLSRWYLSNRHWIPARILVPKTLGDTALLSEAFSAAADRKVQLVRARQGQAMEWYKLARLNAEAALQQLLKDSSRFADRMASLGEILGMERQIKRLECHDISHHGGENTYASCVVFGPLGPLRTGWRCYKLESVKAGDDYQAIRDMLHRRYSRMDAADWPDVLVLDGGKGQLSAALEVLEQHRVNIPRVLGIAKGPSRRAGREQIFTGFGSAQLELTLGSPARLLLQHVRDEAHRFAGRYHRRSMGQKRYQSPLEAIPGVGPALRRALMTHFGSLEQIARADTKALQRIQGIGETLAQTIHKHLRG